MLVNSLPHFIERTDSVLNKDNLFRPSKFESKSDSVNKIAKGMIEADASARQDKTQRLRAARLQRDESEKAQKLACPPKKARKKTSSKVQSAV